MKGFFQIVGEQGHTFGYLGRLDSGHIVHFIFLCNKWLYPETIIFCLYSNYRIYSGISHTFFT